MNQGGSSGSTGMWKGGIALPTPRPRRAACSSRWRPRGSASRPTGSKSPTAIVAVSGDPARKVSYGELIGGRYFDLPMSWNRKLSNDLVAEGQAKPKPPTTIITEVEIDRRTGKV